MGIALPSNFSDGGTKPHLNSNKHFSAADVDLRFDPVIVTSKGLQIGIEDELREGVADLGLKFLQDRPCVE